MKILYFISSSAFLLASHWPATAAIESSEEAAAFVPTRISYRDLNSVLQEDGDDKALIAKSLQVTLQKVGLFSITDIPLFGKEKPETLKSLPACVNSLLRCSELFRGSATRHVLPDGTIRKTIATTGDQRSLLLGDDDVSVPEQCAPLQQVSGAFRDTVAEVTRTVGMVLLRLLNDNYTSLEPRVWNQARDKSYNIAEVVTYGEHLEHFHVYEKPTRNKDDDTKSTLDWHTDQGLMLVFSPGTSNGEPTQEDFYIQLANGQEVSVRFETKDELVVMLGDGVNQYVNNMMNQDEHFFRAVPHRLSVRDGICERVWYGRMVLPPADAVHPFHKRTFGDLRQELISRPQESLGCSSGSASLLAAHERSLQDHNGTAQVQNSTKQAITEDTCNNETEFFCWHRCMNYTELVSPTACEAVVTSDAPHEVACHNPDTNELWPGTHDPDFELGCVDSMVVAAFQQNASMDPDIPEDSHNDQGSSSDSSNDGKGGTGASSGSVASSLTSAVVVILGSMFCF
jgi:hypothetical protein